jgi:hypothetical protein
MPLVQRWPRLVLAFLWLCTLACKPTVSPSQPASLAQPDPDQEAKDLDAFFRGELLTSNVRPPNEPMWPTEQYNSLIWWPLAVFTQPKYGWGIKDLPDLKNALSGTFTEWGERQEGILGWLRDYPAREDLWRHQLDQGDDPIAAFQLGSWLGATRGPKEGLEQLSRVHLEIDDSTPLKTRARAAQIYELKDILPDLQQRLPGVSITLGDPEPVPLSSFSAPRSQLIWENLVADLPPDGGRVYVLEEDLGNLGPTKSFSFAKVDLPNQRAAVSLSRLRTATGKAAGWSEKLAGSSLAVARRRLETVLVSTLARLEGLDFPCPETTCALHERRSVRELADGTAQLCPKHQAMLKAMTGMGAETRSRPK